MASKTAKIAPTEPENGLPYGLRYTQDGCPGCPTPRESCAGLPPLRPGLDSRIPGRPRALPGALGVRRVSLWGAPPAHKGLQTLSTGAMSPGTPARRGIGGHRAYEAAPG